MLDYRQPCYSVVYYLKLLLQSPYKLTLKLHYFFKSLHILPLLPYMEILTKPLFHKKSLNSFAYRYYKSPDAHLSPHLLLVELF